MLGSADERGVDVRGLVWRSHLDQTGFFATENRHLGERLQRRGAEVLLDMRVRPGGSHHQKFVVIRHRDDPSRDVAFVGGIDLAHNRRDDADHHGDPQPQPLTDEYGPNPPWHDLQVRIQGPAVYDVETVFRERWEDPTPLSRSPLRRLSDTGATARRQPGPAPDAAAAAAGGGDAYRAAAADLPEPAARTRLPVRPRRRAQRRPGLHQGDRAGERAGLRRGPVLLGARRRRPVPRRAARPARAAPGRGDPALPGRRRARRIPELLGRNRAFHARDVGGARTGGGVRHREPRRHAGLRARQGLRHRRRLGQRRVRQLQPALVDPRLRALVRRAGRRTTPASLRLTLAAEHLDRLAEVEADGLEHGDGGLRRAGGSCSTPTRPAPTGWTPGTPGVAWGSGRRGGCGGCRCPSSSPFQRRWAKVPLERAPRSRRASRARCAAARSTEDQELS